VVHLTLVTITLGLGVGSEFVQAVIPNGREFDLFDIVENIVGSLVALGGCSWYHMRMLERKRVRRGYGLVSGGGVDGGEDLDVELGEIVGVSVGPQESGEIVPGRVGSATLEAEVDNWDENLEDGWDIDVDGDEHTDHSAGLKTPSASSAGEAEGDVKKRGD